ncbi:Siphovirus ReqiPepy6 Gp37-like protein [Caprobacter fermentans]|uniref:Siphovirus ReqiPepy6 Gp37-like protein n=1 Tax=Caproicibacter fermentans TaxID=2576756 RepID=A0A6N8HZE3_9FIRM|nr:siphovirus ReqiPepy6 Gp37-like family protein [Caproicibacter fermentans]MVB11186.1 Siphovirus ReqiPepy6 Gp37-like protein [Caproicibacter fermentans]
MDLYILDPDINLQGVIDGYSSLRWRRRFFEPGEVELHCKASPENLTLLRPENIIHRLDRKEAAIIEGVSVEGEEITATGRMGSSMLDRRVITPTINFSGTAEAAMRKIVTENRPPSNLALGSAAGLAPTATFQATGKNVLTTCTALARSAPLGFRCRLDVPGKRWVFEVYDGTDRSVTQHDRPYVLFSDEFRNIVNPKYEINTTGAANYAYVAGQDSGENRVIVTVDQTGGAPLLELWVDARDLQQAEGQSLDDYKAQLTQRGVEKLAETARVENFSADAVDTANFAYLTDWELGDIVSFEKWGIRLDQRITEVEEVDEGGVMTITPVCGNPLPEALDLGSDT